MTAPMAAWQWRWPRPLSPGALAARSSWHRRNCLWNVCSSAKTPAGSLISCDQANVARIKEVAAKHGVSAETLGETVIGTIEITVDGKAAVSAKIAELQDEYEGALERALRSEPAAVAAD